MPQTRPILLAAMLLCAAIYCTHAALGAAAENNLQGQLIGNKDLQPRAALAKSFKEIVAMLEYDNGEAPLAYEADFNGDGTIDYLIRSSDRLCGTAGCPYVLIDGKAGRVIGEFFGGVAILRQRINSYPVIQTVSKYDINATHVMTFVHDDGRYRQVAYALLERRGMDKWFTGLKQ